MDRSRGLSKAERQDLLDRIEKLLGDSPKARLVRKIVEQLPAAEDPSRPEQGAASGEVDGPR